MTPGSTAGHRPAPHRRRRSVLRVVSVVVLVGLLVAGVATIVVMALSGTDSPSDDPAAMADGALSASDDVTSEGDSLSDLGDVPGPELDAVTSADGPDAAGIGVDELLNPSVDSAFRITEVTPAEGSSTGGEAVVITGSGFREGIRVRVGGRDSTQVQVLNERKIRAILPPGLPGDASVEVGSAIDVPTIADGLFMYVDRPPRVVMAIRPTVGSLAGGTAVTIVGTGFEPGARVVIGGERAVDVEVVDSTRITATTPAHEAGIVDVVVRNPDMPTAVLPGAFEFVPGPTLSGIDPIQIPEMGGIPVTVRGTGFAAGIEVTFNGLPAFDVQVTDDTVLTAVAPPGVPGPATLVVRNVGEPPATLLDAAFYYVPAPVEEALPDDVPATDASEGAGVLEDAAPVTGDVPAAEGPTPAAG